MIPINSVKLVGIFCKDRNGIIGRKGSHSLLWNCPEDLKHFKELTLNQTVVMGRNTYESLGKPLPHRDNVVISTTMKPTEGIKVYGSVSDFIKQHDLPEHVNTIYVIGGSVVFNSFTSIIDSWIVTTLDIDAKDSGYNDYIYMPTVYNCNMVLDNIKTKYLNTLCNGKEVNMTIQHYRSF